MSFSRYLSKLGQLLNSSGQVLPSGLATGTDFTIAGLTVGKGAGDVSTNTVLGASALAANTTGASSTAIGYQALTSQTSAAANTAVGYQAGYTDTVGVRNVFVGFQAGYTNNANDNTFIGRTSGYSNSSGTENTAIGTSSFYSNTTGSFNTALGRDAMQSNTTASNNTAVGFQAGYSNTTGTGNLFVGRSAGYASTGSGNCFVGYFAGNISTGNANTFIGSGLSGSIYASGELMTTGSKNTILGNFSGNQGGLDIRTASNQIVISDGDGNPIWRSSGSGGAIVTNTPNRASSTTKYAWQTMQSKIILRGTANGTATLLTVTADGGNNRVYARIRFMATTAVGQQFGTAVAYAYINAGSLSTNGVTAFAMENNISGTMPAASLAWSSGVLQMAISASNNYQAYITEVEIVQWDGNASIVFNTNQETFG